MKLYNDQVHEGEKVDEDLKTSRVTSKCLCARACVWLGACMCVSVWMGACVCECVCVCMRAFLAFIFSVNT